jgi:hypothetical protein
MRYQSARVVLGACLVAATVAAQAPTFLSTSALGAGTSLLQRSPLPDGPPPSWRAAKERDVRPQGDPDYSLYGQFRLNHGEFMDRRERFKPQLDLRAQLMPNQRVNDEPGSYDLLGYDVDVEVPVLVSTDGYLTFGAYYMGRRYVTSNAFGTRGNPAGMGDETLIAAGGKLGFGVFLDAEGNWLFEVESAPGAWSDLDDTLHHDDFDFPSHGMFTVRTMPNFFFKFGARYNQVYEDAPWLPLLGFSWEVVDGFRVDILAPENVELSWWPSSTTGILFGAQVSGAEYHVHTSETVNQRDNLRVQEVVAYLGLLTRMSDHTSFLARGGLVVAGDYDLTTGATGFNRIEGALDQGFWAELSFGIDF